MACGGAYMDKVRELFTQDLCMLHISRKMNTGREERESLSKLGCAGHHWLTPIILGTQEAEIRRIAVQSQSRQIVR
jgi:hypothetical protein